MKKKLILSSLIACITIASIPFQSIANEKNNLNLNDVDKNHWAYKSLKKLIKKYKFKIGYPDGTFKGNKKITRYEVASLLAQVLDKAKKANVSNNDNKELVELFNMYTYEMKRIRKDLSDDIEYLDEEIEILKMKHNNIDFSLQQFKESMPFRFFGNIGFRYQLNTNDFEDLSNSVPQMRVSFGLNSKSNDQIQYGLRMVTGARNRPGFTWWKFGDFYNRVGLNLDKFFVKYVPSKNLNITLGKFTNPYSNSELFFDEEITTQGSLQKLQFQNSSWLKEFSLSSGETIVSMDNIFGNTFMLSGLANLDMNLSEMIEFQVKGGYHHYIGEDNLSKANGVATESKQDLRIIGISNRNSLNEDGTFKNSFDHIVNGFAKLTFKLHENAPLVLSGDYLMNMSAPSENMAYQFSARLGTNKKPGNCFIGYKYKHLEKDATVSLFVEDQLGGTNVRAHEAFFGVKVFEKTNFSTTVQMRNDLNPDSKVNYTIRTAIMQSF